MRVSRETEKKAVKLAMGIVAATLMAVAFLMAWIADKSE